MSFVLLGFARSFVSRKITAEEFADKYIELWKIERDSGLLLQDEPGLSECLSSIFCLADMYCVNDDCREECEINGDQLMLEVSKIFSSIELYR